MDPYAQDAYSRIRLFLADLNLVLGSVSYATARPLPNFDRIRFPQNLKLCDPHQQFLSKRPTPRSRAWKKTHSKSFAPNFPSEQWLPRTKSAINRFEFEKRPREDRQCKSYQPLNVPKRFGQTQPNVRYQPPPHSFEADHPFIEAVEHNKPGFNGPEDGRDVYDKPGLGDNLNNEYRSDCNALDNECPSNLDERVDDLPDKEQASETASDNHNPEVLPEIEPESDYPQLPEPAFDMANYSAKDVDRWARTLSAEQFEELRILGPESRIESFRQYAISNLDRPTQTLSSSTHEHLDQPVLPSIGNKDNSDYHHHQPDDVGSNNFDQQQLATLDDESRSTFYNHSDDCNSHLEAFDNNVFDEGFDDGGFDDGRFDDGGFHDGGFDDGGFDDGGFDDGGFDNGGFDDGGFDDGGFDDGGFDDGYGSPYY
ncbi:hypothetical protein PGT21_016743 [Puccinia graminis f. sp. tritici]|uniref:Uncharacterized protein n=1 Tax=Puccinia graminis f. sp. tritici TaxID=56615 RepID=A0A5B0MMZ0_PUCGR|nr:hypothetical protein PGT21_016743 [Puccinia graminis f. sp. tritici]